MIWRECLRNPSSPRIRRAFDPCRESVFWPDAPDICGALADPRRRFIALNGMVSTAKVERLRRALEREMAPLLSDVTADPAGDDLGREAELRRLAAQDRALPHRLSGEQARAAWKHAKEIGLIDLLSSASLIAFAEAVLGRKLDPKGGQQVLRYGPGDYSGPHTDHTPEIKRAAKGYLDMHLTLTSPVGRAAASGLCQERPFQRDRAGARDRLHHDLSPALLALHHAADGEAGAGERAARWVLLGTFLVRGVSDGPAGCDAAVRCGRRCGEPVRRGAQAEGPAADGQPQAGAAGGASGRAAGGAHHAQIRADRSGPYLSRILPPPGG